MTSLFLDFVLLLLASWPSSVSFFPCLAIACAAPCQPADVCVTSWLTRSSSTCARTQRDSTRMADQECTASHTCTMPCCCVIQLQSATSGTRYPTTNRSCIHTSERAGSMVLDIFADTLLCCGGSFSCSTSSESFSSLLATSNSPSLLDLS